MLPPPSSTQDDNVLIAIVTEFGANWHLVADVLRAASTMAGVYRRWDACKQRYIALAKMYQQVGRCRGAVQSCGVWGPW